MVSRIQKSVDDQKIIHRVDLRTPQQRFAEMSPEQREEYARRQKAYREAREGAQAHTRLKFARIDVIQPEPLQARGAQVASIYGTRSMR